MKKVSIIIPFYSHLDWLYEAIESVFAQTYTNYEVILVNDGSKEDMTEFLRIYGDRILYIKQNNAGPAAARNNGIRHATGDYIAFEDSDDIWLPTKLEKQVAFMEQTDTMWNHTGFYYWWPSTGKLKLVNTSRDYDDIREQRRITTQLATPSMLIDARVFKEKQLYFPEDKRNGEDDQLYTELSKLYKISLVEEPLLKVRMREDNSNSHAIERFNLRVENYKKWLANGESLPFMVHFIYKHYELYSSLFGRHSTPLKDKLAKSVWVLPYFWERVYVRFLFKVKKKDDKYILKGPHLNKNYIIFYSRMKILIISQYYYPEQFQINEIAPELVRRGHEVTVLCGIPNYPKGEIFEGYENRFEEVINGVKVIRCKNVPRGHNPLSLVRNYISFYRNANKLVDTLPDDYDVVLSYQLSPISMVIPAVRYKERTGKPLLLYCLDLWPESAQAHVKFKKGLLYRYITRLSGKLYNSCDRILVTSKPFIGYLSRKHRIPESKLGYLPQHADGSMLEQDFSKTGNDGKVHFMYAGNIGAAQTLDVVIKAAAQLGKRSDYVVDFVGDGSKRAELEDMVRKYGLVENVVFHGNQKRADMPSFYRKADVLLITLRGTNAVGDTMPGKLQTYMTVGKPILGAINGAAQQVIEEAQCGSCVKAGDYEGLATLMKNYLEHPKDFDMCGDNARCYFKKHFTLECYMDGLENELKRLVQKV